MIDLGRGRREWGQPALVAQADIESPPEGDKEPQLTRALLNQRDHQEKAGRAVPVA